MKKVLMSVLLLCIGMQGAVLADETESTVPSKETALRNEVEPISQDSITHFRDELRSSERKRTYLFRGVEAGVLALGAYSLYGMVRDFISGKKEESASVDKLNKRTDDLESSMRQAAPYVGEYGQRIAGLESLVRSVIPNYQPPVIPFLEPEKEEDNASIFSKAAFWKYASQIGKFLAHGSFDMAKFTGKVYLSTQLGKFIMPIMPSVGDYFLTSRSIKWCLVKYSDFTDLLVSFKNWYEREGQFGYTLQDKQELALCGSHLVLEAERILGYMQFVQDSLPEKSHGYSFYQNRAKYCVERITDEVNTIVTEINKLSKVTVTPEQLKAYIDLLRRRLFSIVVALESFEVVTSAAEMSSAFEEDIFGTLKRYIYAEWAEDRPEVKSQDENPFDEFFSTMATEF